MSFLYRPPAEAGAPPPAPSRASVMSSSVSTEPMVLHGNPEIPNLSHLADISSSSHYTDDPTQILDLYANPTATAPDPPGAFNPEMKKLSSDANRMSANLWLLQRTAHREVGTPFGRSGEGKHTFKPIRKIRKMPKGLRTGTDQSGMLTY